MTNINIYFCISVNKGGYHYNIITYNIAESHVIFLQTPFRDISTFISDYKLAKVQNDKHQDAYRTKLFKIFKNYTWTLPSKIIPFIPDLKLTKVQNDQE